MSLHLHHFLCGFPPDHKSKWPFYIRNYIITVRYVRQFGRFVNVNRYLIPGVFWVKNL
uniref:Uncharacterized protein n=1 Tax=Octopus bimaculoides TaxID=37653 RepID=A0A0L8FHS2_OCTBM